MPELPEVEVLRRTLVPWLEGERIEGIDVRERRLREPIPVGLTRRVRGRRIERLDRRAKYLLVHLEGDRTLVVHLGMSGRLTLSAADAPRVPHEHVVFELSSGRQLRYRDPRRFGLVFALPTAELPYDRHFRHLGFEPLAGGFDGEALIAARRGRRAPVKAFLMDARVVVGVGNIYACEALFRAGVHPARAVSRISHERMRRVARAVVHVLGDAIEQGGTTLNDFADGLGESGYFQVSLQVYGREGRPCTRCGHGVRRIVQQGRSTFYCATCQR